MIGGIQPGILQRALGQEHRESGLAARLLLTCPPRVAKTWTDADIDPLIESDVARLVNWLYELKPARGSDGETRPTLVALTAEAKAAYVEYYNAHNVEQVCMSGDLAAAWSKLEEYAARFALVLHFTRLAANDPKLESEERVDAESMRAGICLAEWFKNEARRVYTMLDETEGERDRRRLVEWLQLRAGSATAREVQQGCRWLKASGSAETALNELVKAGSGAWQELPAKSNGGRASRAFVLST